MVFLSEAATGDVLWKNVFLKISQNWQENNCVRVSFLLKLQASACSFIKKETLAQLFSCEFCKIFNLTSDLDWFQQKCSKRVKIYI